MTQLLNMEVSEVRRRLQSTISAARERAKGRRGQTAEAEQAFKTFLTEVATPVFKQVANVLKTENYAFTLFTPRASLRLASDHGRDDFIEIALDATADPPGVVGRVSRTRGSRTLTDERPLRPGAKPDAVSEEDVLTFLLQALEPWLER